MLTTFIDYSRHYFENVAGEPLPPRRSGKFVQLWLGSTEEFIVHRKADLTEALVKQKLDNTYGRGIRAGYVFGKFIDIYVGNHGFPFKLLMFSAFLF